MIKLIPSLGLNDILAAVDEVGHTPYDYGKTALNKDSWLHLPACAVDHVRCVLLTLGMRAVHVHVAAASATALMRTALHLDHCQSLQSTAVRDGYSRCADLLAILTTRNGKIRVAMATADCRATEAPEKTCTAT